MKTDTLLSYDCSYSFLNTNKLNLNFPKLNTLTTWPHKPAGHREYLKSGWLICCLNEVGFINQK